jgi:hypothetical protein
MTSYAAINMAYCREVIATIRAHQARNTEDA